MARDTRKCIKEFVRHVETLEAEDDPEGNGFHREYRLIHEVQVKNRRDNVFQMCAGKMDNNLKKNRYKDILPYDEHRVLLSLVEGEENSDYINASRLMGVKGTGGYIASQGPLASTVNDFWRMIWECQVDVVFMACKIVELGKIKCKQYWNDVDKADDFGDINVFTISEEEISFDFICRKFKVTRGDEERNVTQFHYLGWPDHGIPDDPAHIRDLISIMRKTRQNEEAPLVVHCSAGCGRSGAIVAIDFVWTLLEQGRFDETFSLYDLICNFREQRMSMVQTAEQYALVNKVLKALCEEWLDKMASHTYVNVEIKEPTDTDDNVYCNASSIDDAGPRQEDSDLPPPSYQAPKPPDNSAGEVKSSKSYENVVILASGAPSTVQNEADNLTKAKTPDNPGTPLHKTVIQLGSASKMSSSGDPNQVINLVRGVSVTTDSMASAVSTLPYHGIAASNVSQPTSTSKPNMVIQSPPSSSSDDQVNIPTQVKHDIEPVYATVEKRNKTSSVRRTENSLPTPSTETSNVNNPVGLPHINESVIGAGEKRRDDSPLHKNTSGRVARTESNPYSLAQDGAISDSNSLPRDQTLTQNISDNLAQAQNVSLAHDLSDDDPYSTVQEVGNGVDLIGTSAANHKPTRMGSTSSNSSYASSSSSSLRRPHQITTMSNPASPTFKQVSPSSPIPDFGERLPRVKGPVPEPASWSQKL